MRVSKVRSNPLFRIANILILTTFICTSILPPSYAQVVPTLLNLPVPGTFVNPTNAFTPILIRGITIHPKDPLKINFIVNTGHEQLDDDQVKDKADQLIKYFLASLTVPEKEMWVNLSPYEKDRMIPDAFGATEMGRDLLAQDYLLKQLTSSMMYPEEGLGKAFWERVYKKAYEQFGSTDIPVNTFNKIWILPEKAVVYEHGNSA